MLWRAAGLGFAQTLLLWCAGAAPRREGAHEFDFCTYAAKAGECQAVREAA